MTTSCWVAAIRGSSASTNSAASATVLCIFQLAARYGGPLRHRSSASTPGSSLPSNSSNDAPPPVDSQSTFSSSPNWRSAATESPPPTTVVPGARRPPRRPPACRRRRAPARRRPSGRSRERCRRRRSPPRRRPRVRGPMSRPIQPSGTSTPSLSRGSVVGVERAPEDQVDRQRRARTRRSAARSSASLGQLDALLLDQRVAGLDPLGAEEAEAIAPPIRIRSASSRKRSMTPILSETLAPPRTTTSGRCGRLDDPGQLGQLALEQQPGVAGQQARDALGAGVGAVGGAEGVVDVEVGERGERLGELRVVLGLARLEADVLEQQHFAGPERAGHRLDVAADDRRRQVHLGAEQLGRAASPTGAHRERRIDLAPGRPRCETRTSAAPRSRSSSIVGSAARMRVSSATRAVVERDVEVDPDQHPPARRPRRRGRLPSRSSTAPTPGDGSRAQRTLPASSTQRFE